MKLYYKEKLILIKWWYNRENGTTTCSIFFSADGEKGIEAIGDAILSKNDRFEKRIGRKISLTRALGEFSKEVRRTVWESEHPAIKNLKGRWRVDESRGSGKRE